MSDLVNALEAVEERIIAACQRAGRSRDDVTLIAVSKTQPVEFILEAMEAGLTHFGENRPEEAAYKIPEIAARSQHSPYWHMIGHVQSRKARDVINADFELVHSLDSLKLAERYDRMAAEAGICLPVLLEINVSGEEAKYGWQAANWESNQAVRTQLWGEVESLLNLLNLDIQGLMTMAPFEESPEVIRGVFRSLASLRQALEKSFGASNWRHLSMGMTDDFEIAIEEGSTLVRIGRAIFGERSTK